MRETTAGRETRVNSPGEDELQAQSESNGLEGPPCGSVGAARARSDVRNNSHGEGAERINAVLRAESKGRRNNNDSADSVRLEPQKRQRRQEKGALNMGVSVGACECRSRRSAIESRKVPVEPAVIVGAFSTTEKARRKISARTALTTERSQRVLYWYKLLGATAPPLHWSNSKILL